MKKNPLFLLSLMIICSATVFSEQVDRYEFDVPSTIPDVKTGHLHIGPSDPNGPKWGCNDRYLTKDGEPFMPVMAEFHFSRFPAEEWEQQLLKIKAGGVDIVATYLFWIHHEEIEGEFDFSGQRDVRRFVELCEKLDLLVWVRLGPWCHGEVRNGGLPDWLKPKFGIELEGHIGWGQKDPRVRSNDPAYLQYVEKLYAAFGSELKGLMVKDGGPIVGVQVENEYSMRGEGKGTEHIERLIDLAEQNGFKVPFYSVTGWHNAPFPANRVIPMFGGYPARPWNNSTKKLTPEQVYRFDLTSDAGGIGTDIFEASLDSKQDLSPYPLMTCEIGVGNQVTDHRRPWVSTLDGVVPPFTRLGIGAACVGYYVYHGGTNPDGKLSTLQESRATGYPNDCPVKSYDFQAAIRESGRMDEKYVYLRKLHRFMHDFGDQLAPTIAILPDRSPLDNEDFEPLRMSLRTDGDTGFLFVNNHVRGYGQPDRYQVQVQLNKTGKSVRIPRKPVMVPTSSFFVWPIHLDMEDIRLEYATVEPLMILDHGGEKTYVFSQIRGVEAEYVFDESTLSHGESRCVIPSGAETASLFKVQSKTGNDVKVLTLTHEQSLQAHKRYQNGKDQLYLSEANLAFDGETAVLFSEIPGDHVVSVFPSQTSGKGDTEIFEEISLSIPDLKVSKPKITQVESNQWRLTFDSTIPKGSRLRIEYEGDVAQLFIGDRLIYDHFYNGEVFEVGLDRFADILESSPLMLKIKPMNPGKKLYLDVPKPSEQAEVLSIDLVFEQAISL